MLSSIHEDCAAAKGEVPGTTAAATSLVRHYQNQTRPEEARILPTRIYSTFTEGFDTSDMLEAKALLS